jgi:hypothetical protein
MISRLLCSLHVYTNGDDRLQPTKKFIADFGFDAREASLIMQSLA